MAGGGTLLLSGANTYSGATTVSRGKLVLDGWLTNSAVTVQNGGLLSGMGSLTSVTVNAGAQLAPGDPLGVMHLSGSLSLALGSTMDFALDGVATDNEVLMPSGQLILSGQQFGDINFAPLAGFQPGTYTLIDAGTISRQPGKQSQRHGWRTSRDARRASQRQRQGSGAERHPRTLHPRPPRRQCPRPCWLRVAKAETER